MSPLILLLGAILSGCLSCNYFGHFQRPASPDEAGFVATFTQKGITAYAQRGLDLVSVFLDRLDIPDITRVFNAVVTTVEASFRNIRIVDLNLESFDIRLAAEKDLNLAQVSGLTLKLAMDYSLKQKTVPYMESSGWAEISLFDVNISSGIALFTSDTCPYHMKGNISFVQASIGDMQIVLHSEYAELFNAILSILQKSLIALFETLLSDGLTGPLTKVINDQLDTVRVDKEVFYVSSHREIMMPHYVFVDTRLTDFVFDPTFVSVRYPGLLYHIIVDPTNTFIVVDDSEMTPKQGAVESLPNTVNNDDIQFILDRSTFNSMFLTWSVYNKTFDLQLSSNDSSAVSDLLSLDSLEGFLGGISDLFAGIDEGALGVLLRVTQARVPYIPTVMATGLFINMSTDLQIVAHQGDSEVHLATFRVDYGALGTPAVHSIRYTETLNASSFYLDLMFGNSSLTGDSAVANGLYFKPEGAILFADTAFDMFIAPYITEIQKERSIYSENTIFFCNEQHRITLYPPEYFCISANLNNE